MLEELHVRDLALIDEAWLEPGPGLTVLSGETGAGKTVLVGALRLLLGERADAPSVRSGATEALVEGRLTLDGRERTVRRRVSAEGRSRCYLDDEISTVTGLAEALGPSVDLHGQHDHQALLHASAHASYLDRFAGAAADAALIAYRAAFEAHARAAAERDAIADALADRDRKIDYLRFVVDEIDAIAPADGEDVELEARVPLMRHGEKLTGAASEAYRALRDEGGASDAASEAGAALAAVAGIDSELDAVAEALTEASALLDDAASRVRAYGERVDFDPAALNETEARLAALATLKKKYGPALADVLRERARAAEQLDALEAGEEGLTRAESRVAEADADLRRAAEQVTKAREAAVAPFVERLGEAAAELAMPTASFDVAREPLARESWTLDGPERVEFLYSPGKGEPARPLARIASGGEVSRVMLALKSVLGTADTVPILVFDEIDAGIGGATALAVGRRLAALASEHQVLVITHLAQVAAFAERHLVVEKQEREGREVTSVRTVADVERVAEIARMLSGSDTDTALEHARELLESVSSGTV